MGLDRRHTALLPLVLALALLPLLASGAALADDTDHTIAKKYFELGRTLYSRSDYEGAIKQFRESYRLSGKAVLLYDIARSHEALGQPEEAVRAYAEYLRASPTDEVGAQARSASLRQVVERRRVERERVERERRQVAWHRDRQRGSSLPGWLTIGGGATLGLVGAVLAGVAKAKQREVVSAFQSGQPYSSFKSSESQGRALGVAGPVLLGVGAAVAVAGTVLLVLHYRAKGATEREAWLAPAIVPGAAVLAAGGRF